MMLEKISDYDFFLGVLSEEERTGPKVIWYWLFFVLIFLILALFGSILISYDVTKQYLAIVSNDANELKIYVQDSELPVLRDAYLLKDSKKQIFKFVSISDQYIIDGVTPYREVVLRTTLSEKESIVNNVIPLTFVIKKTTFMNEIILYFKGVIF